MSYKFEFVMRYAKEELHGMQKRVPSRADLDRYFINCGGGYSGYDPTVSWCGIFACYIMRKAGLRVKWKRYKGIEDLSGGTDMKAIWGREGIALGDVAVRGSGQHHFILLETPAKDQRVVYAADGNAMGKYNPMLACGRDGRNILPEVTYYYRIY